jgi:hypothetical protein
MTDTQRQAASFRDPSGFVFAREGTLYRQVNRVYEKHYDLLLASGLYRSLTEAGLLIPHTEVDLALAAEPEHAYKVLKPDPIAFISYPYEWCFGQWRAAALLTLEVQEQALKFGMTLKDCSAFNVQFHNGRPVLIDTLSLETYREGQPWVAYRQFCQHFLAPLALMSQVDVRLGQLMRTHLDGVPLDLAAALLKWRSRLSFSLGVHLHLHARAQRSLGTSTKPPRKKGSFTKLAMQGLASSLRSAVEHLRWERMRSEWAEYEQESGYAPEASNQKRRFVAESLGRIRPQVVWDLGANVGHYSRVASERGCLTISCDADPECVERNYQTVVSKAETKLLPLYLDLTNPSPALGWRLRERMSLLERGPADAVLALALVHHLAISGNVPLADLAAFFAEAGRWLVVEWVPKDDPQVSRLLVVREDIFSGYNQQVFEQALGAYFDLEASEKIVDSGRVLYRWRRKDAP